MLKDRQKSEFDGSTDCIIIESLHNPLLTRLLVRVGLELAARSPDGHWSPAQQYR